MKEEGGLQRLGQDIAPVDGPVEVVEPPGVVEGVEGEGNQAEEVDMERAGCGPAPEEDVESDGQIDEADDKGEVEHAAVGGDGNDDDRGVEGNAAAGDGVVCLAVDVGVLELAVEVGADFDRVIVDSGEQVTGLDSGLRSGAGGGDALGEQAVDGLSVGNRCGFCPGDPVVRLLVEALLLQVEDGKQHQRYRRNAQQSGNQTIIETCFHGGSP